MLLSKKDNLSIIRIIATEYALSYGDNIKFYVYIKDNKIAFISFESFYISLFNKIEVDSFTLILYCLFEEFPNVPRITLILNLYKLLYHINDFDLMHLLELKYEQYKKLLLGTGFKFVKKEMVSFYEKEFLKGPEYFMEKLKLNKKYLTMKKLEDVLNGMQR